MIEEFLVSKEAVFDAQFNPISDSGDFNQFIQSIGVDDSSYKNWFAALALYQLAPSHTTQEITCGNFYRLYFLSAEKNSWLSASTTEQLTTKIRILSMEYIDNLTAPTSSATQTLLSIHFCILGPELKKRSLKELLP